MLNEISQHTLEASKRIASAIAVGNAVLNAREAAFRAERAERDALLAFNNLKETKLPQGFVFLVVFNRYNLGHKVYRSDEEGIFTHQVISEDDKQMYGFVASKIDDELLISKRKPVNNNDLKVLGKAYADKDFQNGIEDVLITENEEVHILPRDHLPNEVMLLNTGTSIE